MLMYSACLSMKMLVAKLAQMGNFCLAKCNVMWSMAQMATGNASLAFVRGMTRMKNKIYFNIATLFKFVECLLAVMSILVLIMLSISSRCFLQKIFVFYS